MGLISATAAAVKGVLADQWKEYFYCDAMDTDLLMVRGEKKKGRRLFGSGNHGDDAIISNGSVIAVADGQCMLIVEQGKVVELCADPGEFVWDSSTEPSIFTGSLSDSVCETFKNIGKRISFGGTAAKDQRVYYINTREITGCRYGTASPVQDHGSDSLLYQCSGQCRGCIQKRRDRRPAENRASHCTSAGIRKDFRDGNPLFGGPGTHGRSCRCTE